MSTFPTLESSVARTIRERIVVYLLNHPEPSDRTQIRIMTGVGASQATIVRYLAELIGQGLIAARPFGTSMIYEVQFEKAIRQGLVPDTYKIFDLDSFLALNSQQNPEWTGKVFKFGNMIYIYVRHISGFEIGIPIHDKEWKELIEGLSLGLNLEALFAGFARFISGNQRHGP